MALIEIDGLPFLKMGGSFHGKLLVITRGYMVSRRILRNSWENHGIIMDPGSSNMGNANPKN